MRKKLCHYWKGLVEEVEGQRERGAIDIGAILMMGIGMVFLAVGFIMFPIVTTATTALFDWTATCNATFTDADFTGFTAIIGIVPLLVLVGFLSAAVFSMFLGVKMMKGSTGSTRLDLGAILLLGIAMIFIAIGLIIFPVILDAIAPLVATTQCVSTALSTSDYPGLVPILLVTPLLVLVAFVAGAVVTGFFGIKRLGSV